MIPQEPFGFREVHSTVVQLIRVVKYIAKGMNQNMSIGAIFLDISKAFDKVWLTGILYKLLEIQFPRCLIQTIASYLENRHFHVHFDIAMSTERTTTTQVSSHPCSITSMLAHYAEDTTLLYRYADSKIIHQRLQDHTHKVEDWCNESAALIFHNSHNSTCEDIVMNQRPWKDKTTYLVV